MTFFRPHIKSQRDLVESWHCRSNQTFQDTDFVLPLYINDSDDSVQPIPPLVSGLNSYGINRAVDYLDGLVNTFGLSSVLLIPTESHADTKLLGESSKIMLVPEARPTSTSSATTNPFEVDVFVPPAKFPYLDLTSSIPGTNSDQMRGGSVKVNNSSNSNSTTSTGKNSSIDSDNENNQDKMIAIANNQEVFHHGNNIGDSLNLFISNEDEEKQILLSDQINNLVDGLVDLPKIERITKNRSVASNSVGRLVEKLRHKFPNLLIICDLQTSEPEDESDYVSQSIRLAKRYAALGCDVIAVSNRRKYESIQKTITQLKSKLPNTLILSYCLDFDSEFLDDKLSNIVDAEIHHLPSGSRSLAISEVRKSFKSGASLIGMRPSMGYLDILRDMTRDEDMLNKLFLIMDPESPPIFVMHQTKTEYSILKLAAQNDLIDLKSMIFELFTSYRRAGASVIITHFAPEILKCELL